MDREIRSMREQVAGTKARNVEELMNLQVRLAEGTDVVAWASRAVDSSRVRRESTARLASGAIHLQRCFRGRLPPGISDLDW